jgi:hypothetical protein
METLVMGLLLVAIFGAILFATRKKPGRRYDKQAPGRAEADKDNWSFPG